MAVIYVFYGKYVSVVTYVDMAGAAFRSFVW